MKKIVLICPYFGKLPKNHMDLWLQSCKYNPSIDWIIFTDDRTQFNYPKNVKVNYMSFGELKELFQKKFDFSISLERAYKLCDFKPAYGYVFSDFIKKYDFWGYCDMSDCILGNIRRVINDDILNKYEKIGFLGHLSLYKNSKEVNERFKKGSNSIITYKEVLSSSDNMAFDELNEYSINSIYDYNRIKIYRIDQYYFDISPLYYPFVRSWYDEKYKHSYLKRKPTVFKWSNGRLYEYSIINNEIQKNELLYVHFQKRKMEKTFDGISNEYYIIPNKFTLNFNVNNLKMICKASRFKFYSQFFKLKYKSLKYRLKKLLKV